jgi:hypothetical protein
MAIQSAAGNDVLQCTELITAAELLLYSVATD